MNDLERQTTQILMAQLEAQGKIAIEKAKAKEEYDAYLKANGEFYNDHKIDQDGTYLTRPWIYEKMRKYQEINTEMGILDFNFSNYRAGKKIQEKIGLIL